MDTQHKKRISTAVTPIGDDLPTGFEFADLSLLGKRCQEWLDWRSGKRPEPEWRKGRGQKPKTGEKWGPYTANENGWYSLTPK